MKNMNKKTSRKTTAKKSLVSIKSEGTELDNVDSLVLLNNPKEQRLNGIDERIKFLKTELKSLLGDMKMDKNSNLFGDKSNSVSTLCLDVKKPEDLGTDIKSAGNWKHPKESQSSESVEFRPTLNSTPSKFSAWLNETIDGMESKFQYENTLLPDLEAQINLACETPLPDSFLSSCRFSNSCLLTQESVEQLLYKSFLLQNSEVYLYGSQNSDAEPDRSTSLTKQKTFKKSKKPQKTVRMERPKQNSVRPCRRYQRRGERRRLSNLSSLQSDIEIINLDNTPGSNKTPQKSIVCVDLDVSGYDWSEPFDINKETQETHPGVQVLEYGRKKSDHGNHEELNSNRPEVAKNDTSISNDESSVIQEKQGWECPVCFEKSKGQEIVATKCGHVFCRKCLENHISKVSNNCPSCRHDLFTVQDKPFITLFNC